MKKDIINEAEELNRKYNFFITINHDFKEGTPISVKDNICTNGIRTTAGSKILKNYVPVFDGTVIEKAKKEGYSIVGKTSMDEFGFGSFSVNCGYDIPKNPLDETRSCGGSSGGGAGYTYKSKFCNASIVESTGGSISCPAAFCSVVGITPTYGLVSRHGLIDYANSLDKIGVFGKTVRDCAKLLNCIAGYDKKDSTSIKKEKENYESYLGKDAKKLKIGIIKEFSMGLNMDIEKDFWDSVKTLEKNNVKYEKVSLKLNDLVLPTYYIIAMCEASTNLAKFCGIRYGMSKEMKGQFNEYFSDVRENYFGKEAKRRILLGTFMRMAGYRDAYYIKALKLRTLITNEYKKLFKKFDLILTPTMPILPPKFSEIDKLSAVQNYMCDILTTGPNLCGFPMISVPVKKDKMSGLHFIADHLQENKIISIGDLYERIR